MTKKPKKDLVNLGMIIFPVIIIALIIVGSLYHRALKF
jgi:heme/copper-type cytochrome/quinol oxidase subunit 4